MSTQIREDQVYDAIIVGGGLAGLTAAYMLRDKNILALEKESRFGGRVYSEQVDGLTNNIGTQFFSDSDSSMVQMFDELGVKKIARNQITAIIALNLNGRYYPTALKYITPRFVFQSIKLLFRSYRKYQTFLLPMDSPRWQALVKGNTKDLFEDCGEEVLALLYTFLRGACLSKPERTSAGIGAAFVGSVYDSGDIAFVEGGFQQITDRLARSVEGKILSNAAVTNVVERDGLVQVRFSYQGEDFTLKAKAAVIATPTPVIAGFMPELPAKKLDVLQRVAYGPITVVSLKLKKSVPWQRFFTLISDSTIFQGAVDQTMATEVDKNPDKPILLNLLITHYPDETEEIADFLAKSNDEIIALSVSDFGRVVPNAQTIEDYILESKVTRYPIGELELSPEYYAELLPELEKSVGNIHFCGDYTGRMSFIDGAVSSAFRVARELDSKFVVSEQAEGASLRHPKYGTWGISAIVLNILLIGLGISSASMIGMTAITLGGTLLAGTVLFPIYFPPVKQVYQLIFGVSGILTLLAGLVLI